MAATLPHLGRVDGMAHADYLAVQAVNAGGLKALRKSPLHWRMLTDPLLQHEPKATSPQQFAGTLMHCALLEPEAFPHRYPVGPDASRASREWKAWAQALDTDAQPITPLQAKVAAAQAASLRAEKNVADLFARDGVNEVSIFWRDKATGLLCKARPDRVVPTAAGVILFDAKTAADASRAGFARAAANFYYHTQAAWYTRGWEAATGERVAGFLFGVVESDFPYMAAAYEIHPRNMEAADAECTRWLALLAQCEAQQTWPGYPDGLAYPLELPAWAFSEDRIV